jgi:hypothetical protein
LAPLSFEAIANRAIVFVTPKEGGNSLKLEKGDRLKASIDSKKGFLIYQTVIDLGDKV